MTRFNLVLRSLSLAVVILITSMTFADEQRYPFGYRIGAVTGVNDHCCWSANDYCRKPLPRVPCAAAGCYPDCFTRKPAPAIPCVAGCVTANDYIRKCYPCPPGQCVTPGLPRSIFSSKLQSRGNDLK